MVDRHYSLNLKPWSARTLYVYAHADLAQKYSVGLQEILVSRLCSQEKNSFFLSCPGAVLEFHNGLTSSAYPTVVMEMYAHQNPSGTPLVNGSGKCSVLCFRSCEVNIVEM
jgi:hypothetical protein